MPRDMRTKTPAGTLPYLWLTLPVSPPSHGEIVINQLRYFVNYDITQKSECTPQFAFVSGSEPFCLPSRIWHLSCCLDPTPKPITAVIAA